MTTFLSNATLFRFDTSLSHLPSIEVSYERRLWPAGFKIPNSRFNILRREIYMNLWVLTGQFDQL
jgi:hypothetical protein